ncbi:Lipoprotein releasing system ATP-binding protein LolD [Coxiella-like endosymbiont]|nr:Lipoprotein releasing system ATP-binding protein LolD [Coxiella-like endosymbiont]
MSILDKVNFSVAPGESVAILGASGVGKSTFLQLLAGLDKPTTGKIWVGGKNINRLTERKKGLLRNRYLGFIYQFHYLLTEFNVLENVCIPLLVRGMKPKLAKEKAIAYVEKIGLIHRQKYQVGKLSGGEKQRIAIARALVTEPRCVLADEPTGNLDEKTADQVADLTLQLNRSLNTSFIIVTHNRLLSAKMDRIFLLEKGHLYIQEK